MHNCIAMFRGINVSGHKTIKMEQLRNSFLDLGFRNVRTYVQSGNVVFETGEAVEALSAKIDKKIRDDCGFEAPVTVKSVEELADIVKRNPFVSDKKVDQTKLHVTFLLADPPKNALQLLQPLAATSERISIVGRQVYLYCPNGYGRTKLNNTAIEKKLTCAATTRNWNTTKALLEMAEASA